MINGKRDKSGISLRSQAGLGRYLREAFQYRWNLLLFLGSVTASVISPWPSALLPLVLAGELTYLTGLISIPRFRAAIDAKAHQQATERRSPKGIPPARSVADIITGLPPEARQRFERLHTRCLEMRSIAHGVRGQTDSKGGGGEDIRTPALDRLLWVFLRLLLSQDALNRFLATTDEDGIRQHLDTLRQNLQKAEAAPAGTDDRIVRSLRDSVAVSELRLENYLKAIKNAEFVAVELDRIESKIKVLTEMSINRQDPDVLSSQVDSVAESMRHTEKAISELQHITGLTDELEEPPPILESDLREVLHNEA